MTRTDSATLTAVDNLHKAYFYTVRFFKKIVLAYILITVYWPVIKIMNLCCFIDQVGYNNLSIILSPPSPKNPVVDLLEFKIHINHKFIQSTSGSVLICLE